MNKLLKLELAAVDWSSMRVMEGIDAARIPTAVERLVSAESEEEAREAYWQLDNTVVVQGQLFEAAQHLVPALHAALVGELASPAREAIADLLVEICAGEADESEVALGNEQLGDSCRAAVSEGIWLMYGLLLDQDPRTRRWGVLIIHVADRNRDRAARTIRHLAQNDPDESVRKEAETALAALDRGS